MTELLTWARRYVTAAHIKGINPAASELMPYGARTDDIVHDAWLEWHVVADDDPRIGIVEVLDAQVR